MFRYILGMSDSLSVIRSELKSGCDPLDHHLIKLILFSNSPSRDHWKHEVYSFLNKVSRAKNNKKFPKYQFIRAALAADEDILDNYIIQVKSDYSDLTCSNISDNAVVSIVTAYHDWLAKQLSEKGIVSKADVLAELVTLGIE